MSSEDVELVLSLQLGVNEDAASLASDADARAAYLAKVADYLDPEFVCVMRFPGINPVTYRGGVEALRAAWEDRLKYWAEYRPEIEGVIDAEGKVVVFHRAYVRRTATSAERVLSVAAVWTVRGHRLVAAEFNVPQAEARAIAYETSVRNA